MRDDDVAASASGKDVVRLRLVVQAVGGAFGGLSGALLVGLHRRLVALGVGIRRDARVS